MNLISTPVQVPRKGCIRLSGVDWKTYLRLHKILDERHDVRLTYDRGELEIMAPSLEHDKDGRFIGRQVVTLTEELGLPVLSGGSVTLRRRLRKGGIEADECFWITNASRMAGLRRLDLRKDPPPDLAIEVDVTHSSMEHLGIYARLEIPELWRLEGETLTFYVLSPDGKYNKALVSKAFPLVTPADLLRFLQRVWQGEEENTVIGQFREWVRQLPQAPAP